MLGLRPMLIEFDSSDTIEGVIRTATTASKHFGEDFEPQVRPADPRFGDFQANGVLPFAKKNNTNPRELAQKLIDALPQTDLWETSIAGPGFINFKLSPSYFLQWLEKFADNESIQKSIQTEKPKKIVLDYSGPNTAKQMHVGHIRSTIIGESLARLLQFLGHEVIRDNHLGDWGTQFGILLYAIKREQIVLDQLGPDPIAKLENLYRQGNKWIKEEESNLAEAREELVKLQNGDSENLTLWRKIKEISMDSFLSIYEILGVRFDHSLGESFYKDKVESIYEKLLSHQICKEDQGALVVFHPEHKRFSKQPFIIRKSDGASNYATTDLATVEYRKNEWNSDQIIYVTDGRQRDHFEQLFLTVEKWYSAEKRESPSLQHVWFGTILGDDNKAIKTRDGEPIKLIDLLNEAISRARKMVIEKKPDLTEEEVEKRSKAIGLGAVRYADLSQDRTLDYVFSWEKMLAMQGNTAPYLQYAVARICSIFRKAQVVPTQIPSTHYQPTTDSERSLARKFLFFPGVIKQTAKELKPHFLGCYLYELATEFSSFYNQSKVMVEEDEIKSLRLTLCARSLSILQIGMDILGIELLEEM
ncbi:MAG: arginine--tRNA ligase [Opitutales bacterium]|nr:arginine--tRNA ligase [Opitutales bacterium]